MNVSKGDLAIIIKDGETVKTAGRIVEVLHLAPKTDFHLPDGYYHFGIASDLPMWVVKFESGTIKAPIGSDGIMKKTRETRYAVVDDRVLRPISGIPDTEDTDTKEPIKEVA